MSRILFTCAYDGQSYLGWQSQRGRGTIQDCIEAAMAGILKRPLRIAAAGRTDAGVHALGQRFHVDIPASCRMQAAQWQAALNALLPPSIRITAAQGVADDFHARFNAVAKSYDYLICRAPVLSPFLAGRAWHLPRDWSPALMAEALRCYEGEHDFRRLSARRGTEPAEPPPSYYRRRIDRAALCEEGDILRLSFCGNGFMYRMVRLLVGTAHQVARGKINLDQLRAYMTQPGETTRYCAPADGLYLRDVQYDPPPENSAPGGSPPPATPGEKTTPA